MEVATADCPFNKINMDQIQKLYGQAESTVMHFHIGTFAIRVCVKYTTIKQNSCGDWRRNSSAEESGQVWCDQRGCHQTHHKTVLAHRAKAYTLAWGTSASLQVSCKVTHTSETDCKWIWTHLRNTRLVFFPKSLGIIRELMQVLVSCSH